jgi:predicted nucleic acid-binding protein
MLVFPVFTMGGQDIALEAALYARVMRSQGVRVSTINCMIATFCIKSGCGLLTSDRHFQPFVDALGLVIAE